MLHLVLYGLLAVFVAVGLFLLAARFLPAGEQIAPPLRDEPPWELPPDRSLQAADVDAVRLPVALRGYRFAETDVLLDRLASELRSRDAEIARLRARVPVSLVKRRSDDGHDRYAPPPLSAPPVDEATPPVDAAAPLAKDAAVEAGGPGAGAA